LAADEIHKQPEGLASMAFQLRHIAGSIDRLLTYAEAGAFIRKADASVRRREVAGWNAEGNSRGT
jgi:hypothetical protein